MTIFGDQNPTAPRRHTEALQQSAPPGSNAPANDTAEQLGRRVQNWVTAELERVWSKTTGRCGGQPAECGAVAARLADFARLQNQAGALPEDAKALGLRLQTFHAAVAPAPSTEKVPLPPLRPQQQPRFTRRSTQGEAEAAGDKEKLRFELKRNMLF